MRLISTSMIKPDMVLAKSIYHNECLILKAGTTDLGRYTNHLNKYGIDFVYVEDSKSIGIEIPDAISEETRVLCKQVLREVYDKLSSQSVVDLSFMYDAITNIVDEVLNSDIQISLNDICGADEYTFSHSVSTTVYALLIAKQLNYNKNMLRKLAAGTLLHDMGKVLLDRKILFKEGKLEPDEYEYVKKHTTLGYEELKKSLDLTELSRVISLYHHERMDASGYPTGVPAGSLHEFARIVAIADVYDALTSDRCYRKKWSANKAVNYLIESSGTQFDTRLVSVFIKNIAIYPNGSMVKLSNNSIGIVKEQNRNMPLRPVIRVIADENMQDIEIYEIDLMKELSITILESEIEMDFNREARTQEANRD